MSYRPGWVRQLGNRGTAALEFGLLAPVLIVVLAGVVDLGNAMLTRIRLESAIAAGATYALLPANIALVNSTSGAVLAANIATIVTNTNQGRAPDATVVVNNGPSVTVTGGTQTPGGTASYANLFYCPTGSPPSWTWGNAVSAGATCSSGGSAGQFLTITASYSYTPLFPLYSFVQNGTMTVGTAVQIQ